MPLADPQYYSNAANDLLLGIDVFTIIIKKGLETGKIHNVVSQQTTIGWILTCSSSHPIPSKIPNVQNVSIDEDGSKLNKTLENCFTLESVPEPTNTMTMSKEEAKCEKRFKDTFTRDGNGRYMVRLQFKNTHIEFHNFL